VHLATPIAVQPYAPADADFVRALAEEAFSEYDGTAERAGSHTVAMARAARTLVAESANRRLGFVTLVVDGEAAHIVAIAVVPSVRGRGVGARLLRDGERLARVLGARVVALETGEANLAALDMFIRAGYRVDGRIPRYYRTGYDALTLRRSLVA
jgi:[ribosomal protein S18]-alanine N-acetyltransferase